MITLAIMLGVVAIACSGFSMYAAYRAGRA